MKYTFHVNISKVRFREIISGISGKIVCPKRLRYNEIYDVYISDMIGLIF